MNKYNNYDEVALVFKRLAQTDDFKDAMAVLEGKFKLPPLTPNTAADGMALALLTQHRIGEYNVIDFINKMINREIGKDVGPSDE